MVTVTSAQALTSSILSERDCSIARQATQVAFVTLPQGSCTCHREWSRLIPG